MSLPKIGKSMMSEEEIQTMKDQIDKMSQEDMGRLWRFAPSGHPYFQTDSPLWEYFKAKFNGFTPKLSKKIGWD